MAPPTKFKTYSKRTIPYRLNSSIEVFDTLFAQNISKRKEHCQAKTRAKRKKTIEIKELPPPDKNHYLIEDSINRSWGLDDTFDKVRKISVYNNSAKNTKLQSGINLSKSNEESKICIENSGNFKSYPQEKTLDKSVNISLCIERVPIFDKSEDLSFLSSTESSIETKSVAHQVRDNTNDNCDLSCSYESFFSRNIKEHIDRRINIVSTPAVSSTPQKLSFLFNNLSPISKKYSSQLLIESYAEIKNWDVNPPNFENSQLFNATPKRKYKECVGKTEQQKKGKNPFSQIFPDESYDQESDWKLKSPSKIQLDTFVDIIGINNCVKLSTSNCTGFSSFDTKEKIILDKLLVDEVFNEVFVELCEQHRSNNEKIEQNRMQSSLRYINLRRRRVVTSGNSYQLKCNTKDLTVTKSNLDDIFKTDNSNNDIEEISSNKTEDSIANISNNKDKHNKLEKLDIGELLETSDIILSTPTKELIKRKPLYINHKNMEPECKPNISRLETKASNSKDELSTGDVTVLNQKSNSRSSSDIVKDHSATNYERNTNVEDEVAAIRCEKKAGIEDEVIFICESNSCSTQNPYDSRLWETEHSYCKGYLDLSETNYKRNTNVEDEVAAIICEKKAGIEDEMIFIHENDSCSTQNLYDSRLWETEHSYCKSYLEFNDSEVIEVLSSDDEQSLLSKSICSNSFYNEDNLENLFYDSNYSVKNSQNNDYYKDDLANVEDNSENSFNDSDYSVENTQNNDHYEDDLSNVEDNSENPFSYSNYSVENGQNDDHYEDVLSNVEDNSENSFSYSNYSVENSQNDNHYEDDLLNVEDNSENSFNDSDYSVENTQNNDHYEDDLSNVEDNSENPFSYSNYSVENSQNDNHYEDDLLNVEDNSENSFNDSDYSIENSQNDDHYEDVLSNVEYNNEEQHIDTLTQSNLEKMDILKMENHSVEDVNLKIKTVNDLVQPDLITIAEETLRSIDECLVSNQISKDISIYRTVELKAGKPWRRSFLALRRYSMLNCKGCMLNKGCICSCSKSQSPKKDYFSNKHCLSVKIVPELLNSTLEPDISVLKNYALNTTITYGVDTTQQPDYQEGIIGDQLIVKNNSSIHETTLVNKPPITAEEIVLRLCGQLEPSSFQKCYPPQVLQNCFKVGEGVYGEVFLFKNSNGTGSVMKIIPIEGSQMVNGERQKKYDEVLSEIIIAKELSNLRNGTKNNTGGFSEVLNVLCIQGRYPDRLVELWELWDEQHNSENDSPEMFMDDQLYIVFEFANAGKDMEAFVFNHALQAFALFKQTACALAVAELSLEFEHRDLHWGNILISQTSKKELTYCLDGKQFIIPTCGIQVSIIDFTLSRITHDGVCIYNDLAMDPDLFTATGDYQFQIYKLMQEHNNNDWQAFQPFSNVLWLDYVLEKIINALRYKSIRSKIHKDAMKKLVDFKKRALNYRSAKDLVINEFS